LNVASFMPQRWLNGLRGSLVRSLRGRLATTQSLKHLETLSLGMKRQLLLVECDGKRFLISSVGEYMSAPVPTEQSRVLQNGSECPR
jgi:flagellar biogenesis protein FliO